MYYIGFCQEIDPPVAPWFFHMPLLEPQAYNPPIQWTELQIAMSTPKLTYLRMLNIMCIGIFGMAKATLAYRGDTSDSTTLDWVLGVALAILCVLCMSGSSLC
jgi:hypothetical protein